MNRREWQVLCDRTVERFALRGSATYRDACRRVGEIMSEILDAQVELKFVVIPDSRLTGVTAQRMDGTYVVYCARSRSWYHRLGILLHELAHLLLEHRPVTLDTEESLRRFAPHLPDKMVHLLAHRNVHTTDEEKEAEELADELLGRLTEQQRMAGTREVAPHIMRIAEVLGDHDRTDD
ncbi:hypothetical protein [Nonomuraea lactucae]|uniref:hypothetical protein n=1 Tax=Nonomuraea lactucae TaxID=2249762 RepID=UPI0013B3B9BD|nr:hypothetical protein [Nonomuraea lactucae]